MYGLVNKAIEGLITAQHGEDVWRQIIERAGVEEPGFVSMDPYDDALTYGIVGAASEVLQVEAAKLLEAFGEYWILYTAEEGYGDLLEMSGSSFEDFLSNLDNLHARVALSFPGLRPPSFRCERISDDTVHLHYHSGREGLAPMVVGLLRGLGSRFGLALETALIQGRPDGDHDVFEVRIQSS